MTTSMGPQLDSCGRRAPTEVWSLWPPTSMGPQLDSCGRSVPPVVRERAVLELQWGRNLIVAEGWSLAPSAWPPYALQWGRNLIVAEGLGRARAREYLGTSMGPQLDSCGRSILAGARPGTRGTSMGPQLDSCGRRAPPKKTPTKKAALQWGRNLIVAEGRSRFFGFCRLIILQWGRNLIVAEGLTSFLRPWRER